MFKLITKESLLSTKMTLEQKGYLYLYHILRKENIESVLSHKMVYSEYDRYKNKMQVKGVYSITTFNFKKPWSVDPGQYPGLYMSLTNRLPELNDNEIALIFPIEILYRQKNWHFNLFDRNGTIGYDTYIHDNIHLVPDFDDVKKFYMEKIRRYYNEVVFHDSIDMRNCQSVYDGKTNYPILEYSNGTIKNENITDNREGSFLYYSDRWYSGMDVPYYSLPNEITTSLDFYRNYVKKYVPHLEEKLNRAESKREIEHIIEEEDLFTQSYLNRY